MRTFVAILVLGAGAPFLTAAPPVSLLESQPLRFEQNLGQAPDEFRYVAQGRGYVLGLTSDGYEIIAGGERFRTRLIGANREVRLHPERELPGRTNYFVGASNTWRRGVRSFERVVY